MVAGISVYGQSSRMWFLSMEKKKSKSLNEGITGDSGDILKESTEASGTLEEQHGEMLL